MNLEPFHGTWQYKLNYAAAKTGMVDEVDTQHVF